MVFYEGPPPLLLVFSGLLLVGLLAALRPYRRRPTRKSFAILVAMAVAFATVSGISVAWALGAYVANNTWQFEYDVSLEGNTSYPESVIVPVPQDASLLANLRLTSSQANWSLVDTPHGLGLFIQFNGTAEAQTSVTLPPPHPDPYGGVPTMPASANCTAVNWAANCTGLPRYWVYYSGSAGVRLVFLLGIGAMTVLRVYPAVGWGTYESGFVIA